MSDYRSSEGYSKTYTTKSATITSGNSLSSVVDLEQLNITGLQLPSSWTSAKLTFQVSADGVTFGDLLDSSGNEIRLTVAAGKFIGVNLSELSGVRFLKIRSGTSGTPVNQAADRTISIVLTANAEAGSGGSILSDVWDSILHALKVTFASLIAGEDIGNDVLKTEQRSDYMNLTASAPVKSQAGRLFGIFVASASSTPTIKVWDNTAGSGAVLVNTFTPTAGQTYNFYGAQFGNGLYITISGTVDCTVFFK